MALYLGVPIFTAFLVKRRTRRLETTTGKHNSILANTKHKTKINLTIYSIGISLHFLEGKEYKLFRNRPSFVCFHNTFTDLCFRVFFFDRRARKASRFFSFGSSPRHNPTVPSLVAIHSLAVLALAVSLSFVLSSKKRNAVNSIAL